MYKCTVGGSPEVICGEVSGSVQTGEQGESIALGEPELDLAILVTTEVKTGFVYCTGVHSHSPVA